MSDVKKPRYCYVRKRMTNLCHDKWCMAMRLLAKLEAFNKYLASKIKELH